MVFTKGRRGCATSAKRSQLAAKVQRELQRVLWQAITSRKRTLFGRPINDLEALFDAVRASPAAAGVAGGRGPSPIDHGPRREPTEARVRPSDVEGAPQLNSAAERAELRGGVVQVVEHEGEGDGEGEGEGEGQGQG